MIENCVDRWEGLLGRVQLRCNSARCFVLCSFACRRQIHGDRLLRIDRDGVENDLPFTAVHIESVEEILNADIVGGKGGRIVLGESRRCPRDGSGRISVVCGVNQDDMIYCLKRP